MPLLALLVVAPDNLPSQDSTKCKAAGGAVLIMVMFPTTPVEAPEALEHSNSNSSHIQANSNHINRHIQSHYPQINYINSGWHRSMLRNSCGSDRSMLVLPSCSQPQRKQMERLLRCLLD